jgi:hypothetical protein
LDEPTDFDLLHTNWEEIQSLSEKIASKIIKSGYKPDIIVAVSRGGFDPARILCDQLDVKRLASVQVEYYAGVEHKKEVPQIVYPLNADVSGLKVLVVDDVSDTGDSLRITHDHIVQGGAKEVRVATLHIKPWTCYRPDYHAVETKKWIVYPWEPIESVRSISAKLKHEGLKPGEIKEKLIELGFDPKFLKRLPQSSSKT